MAKRTPHQEADYCGCKEGRAGILLDQGFYINHHLVDVMLSDIPGGSAQLFGRRVR